MACLDCLEKRAAVLNAIGLGRFAPDLAAARREAGVVAPVAHVQPELAAAEFDAPQPVRMAFEKMLRASDGYNVAHITHAAAHLIAFALINVCDNQKCADEQIGNICETLTRMTHLRYDPDSGRRREVVIAKAVFP